MRARLFESHTSGTNSVRRYLVVLAVLAVVFVATMTGCAFQKDMPGLAADPDVQAAQRVVPYDLVLPSYIPDDFELINVKIDEPPTPEDTLFYVHLVFQLKDGHPVRDALTITQSQVTEDFRSITGNDITVGPVVGQYVEDHSEWEDGPVTFRGVTFRLDTVGIRMNSYHLSKEELLLIAESMFEAG